MFFFNKKKENASLLNLSWLVADMHSHLIPGIDDGVPDITTSLAMIRGLQALGYKKLITTPHVLWDVYPNTTEQIVQGLTELKKAVADEGLEIEIEAAAEYFIDEHFEDCLKNKIPLLPLSGNKVLVEFSMITAPMDLQQLLFEIQIQGYQPVIAHPERYIYMANRKSFFDDLKNAGCLFQLNLLSLTNYYGRSRLVCQRIPTLSKNKKTSPVMTLSMPCFCMLSDRICSNSILFKSIIHPMSSLIMCSS
jgi:tyrosine-protein phosphatase YwqE